MGAWNQLKVNNAEPLRVLVNGVAPDVVNVNGVRIYPMGNFRINGRFQLPEYSGSNIQDMALVLDRLIIFANDRVYWTSPLPRSGTFASMAVRWTWWTGQTEIAKGKHRADVSYINFVSNGELFKAEISNEDWNATKMRSVVATATTSGGGDPQGVMYIEARDATQVKYTSRETPFASVTTDSFSSLNSPRYLSLGCFTLTNLSSSGNQIYVNTSNDYQSKAKASNGSEGTFSGSSTSQMWVEPEIIGQDPCVSWYGGRQQFPGLWIVDAYDQNRVAWRAVDGSNKFTVIQRSASDKPLDTVWILKQWTISSVLCSILVSIYSSHISIRSHPCMTASDYYLSDRSFGTDMPTLQYIWGVDFNIYSNYLCIIASTTDDKYVCICANITYSNSGQGVIANLVAINSCIYIDDADGRPFKVICDQYSSHSYIITLKGVLIDIMPG